MKNLIHRKPTLLIAVILTLGVCVIFIASRSTFQLAARYFELRSNLKVLEGMPTKMLSDRPREMFQEIDLDAELFRVITEAARKHDVKIKNINAPFYYNTPNLSVLTKEVVLEGGFTNSIKCLDEAARLLKYAKLSSLEFQRDVSPKTSALHTRVYFQTIKRNDKDSAH